MHKSLALALSMYTLTTVASADVLPVSRLSTLDISYFSIMGQPPPPEHYSTSQFGFWNQYNQTSFTDSLGASAHFNLTPGGGMISQYWSATLTYTFDAVAGTPYTISGSMFSGRGLVSFSLTGPGVNHSQTLRADPPSSAPLAFSGVFQAGRYVLTAAASASTIEQAMLDFTASFPAPTCYANCDGSTAAPVLNVNDFVCFQGAFAAGDSYANCDGSTTAPVLNVNDFICFQQRFATGCP